MTGTSTPALRYMRYFAYWPMLLHEAPLTRALVVCYGLGATAGTVLDIPSIETLDVAEISSGVVAASDLAHAQGSNPLRDPRVRLHLEDGRFYLQRATTRFDLITGESPPPRTPGAVNIYTEEYFRLIYDCLADGVMTTYWLPVARPDPGTRPQSDPGPGYSSSISPRLSNESAAVHPEMPAVAHFAPPMCRRPANSPRTNRSKSRVRSEK